MKKILLGTIALLFTASLSAYGAESADEESADVVEETSTPEPEAEPNARVDVSDETPIPLTASNPVKVCISFLPDGEGGVKFKVDGDSKHKHKHKHKKHK